MPIIDIEKKHLDLVKQILKKVLGENSDIIVFVFGSRIKGNAEKFSDLDLAIFKEGKKVPKLVAELLYEFEESDLPFKVDVIDLNDVSENFRKTIEKDLVKIEYQKKIPEGWREVRLGKLCKSKPDYGLNAPAINYNPLLPLYLRITDITSDGLYDQTNAVSVEYYETEKLLSKNDFLFARTGATVGKTYLHKDVGKKIAFAGYLIRFVIDQSKIIPYFLKLYCQTIYYLDWVRIYSLRSGQPGINAEEYSNLIILLPPLSEQIAIAKILSEWDHAIDLVSHKIELKERLKKGLMQRLLTGKVRLKGFDGEWRKVRLGECLKIKHGKSQIEIEDIHGKYPILATGGEIGRTNDYLYDKESVLIGRKGTINNPMYIETPFWTIDTLFYSQIKSNSNAKFLYYTFQAINWYTYNEGSTIPSLSASTIMNIKILLPSLSEQTAIAEILTTADDEISLLKKQLDALKLQKKGLMQKLLTGEWSTKDIRM
ncbi:MAG: restriction endonuclease subunit S [Alphaproteobacteria bacterium]|nr:restriction endonuclease subunit S [Alphaproteobacteria bacterium]